MFEVSLESPIIGIAMGRERREKKEHTMYNVQYKMYIVFMCNGLHTRCVYLRVVHNTHAENIFYVFKMFFISLLLKDVKERAYNMCATYPNALIGKIVSFALFAPSCASFRNSPNHRDWFCCLHVQKSYPLIAMA